MPTMAKLFSAIMMAVLGWIGADTVGAHLPEEVQQAMLRPITAFLGLIIGWRFLGRRVGRNWRTAIGFGLSSVVFLVVAGVFTFSVLEMLKRALRKTYEGPVDAIEGVFEIAADFGRDYLPHADVVTTGIIGGIVVGIVAEFIARRWS